MASRVRYVIWIVSHSPIIGIRHRTIPAITIFHISAAGYSPIRKIRKPQMMKIPPSRVKSAVAKLTASMQVYWIKVRAIITRSSTALMSSLSGHRMIFNIVRRIFIVHLFHAWMMGSRILEVLSCQKILVSCLKTTRASLCENGTGFRRVPNCYRAARISRVS